MVGDDMRIRRLGPPEARPLLSDFASDTGDPDLDRKLRAARARFLSRDHQDRLDALKDLWDAFERLKTLERGADKKASLQQLISRATFDSPFRGHLDAESAELTRIGNEFHIRHFEHDTAPLPEPAETAIDHLFTRMLSLVMYLLRQIRRI